MELKSTFCSSQTIRRQVLIFQVLSLLIVAGSLLTRAVTLSFAEFFVLVDMEKVMNAMDITPRPKLIVTILKSLCHVGATYKSDSLILSDEMFTHKLYIAEATKQDHDETTRKMALFLKEYLLPVCIKTNALVFLYDATCLLSATFGGLCQAERVKRNGSLPFTVMTIVGADSVAERANLDEDSYARMIRNGSRRWKRCSLHGPPSHSSSNALTHPRPYYSNSPIHDQIKKMSRQFVDALLFSVLNFYCVAMQIIRRSCRYLRLIVS